MALEVKVVTDADDVSPAMTNGALDPTGSCNKTTLPTPPT